jgi:hypothetical protein
MRTLVSIFALFLISSNATAGVERELKRMIGFTIVHAGYITDTAEKNYSEKFIKIDNGVVFKLDCMILMPLNMTEVIVFGKKIPEDVLKKYPNLPSSLTTQYKILIDRDVCDATPTK